MSIDSLKVEIFDVISRSDGNSINKCYAIFSRITKASSVEDQADLFKFACEYYGTKKSTKDLKLPSVIDEEERDELERHLGKYVNGVLDTFLRRNLTEMEFYLSLWKQIADDSFILSEEREKVFALYYILIDKRIPYFQLGKSIEMSDEEYRAIMDRLTLVKHKIRFVLSIPIRSKTERAGYLLTLLDEYIDSPKERAVVMSYLIESVKKQRESTTSLLSNIAKLQNLSLQELPSALDLLSDLSEED
jgi:hypothetical protein